MNSPVEGRVHLRVAAGFRDMKYYFRLGSTGTIIDERDRMSGRPECGAGT